MPRCWMRRWRDMGTTPDLLHEGAEPGAVIQAFNEYQLLCALREGPFGVSGLNERIEQVMAQNVKFIVRRIAAVV